MDQKDKNVRKQWLTLWIVCLLLSVFHFLFRTGAHLSPEVSQKTLRLIIASNLGILGIISYITYHCIYKKSGTKWACLIIFSCSLGLITTPLAYLTNPGYFNGYTSFDIGLTGLGYLLNIPWIFLCVKMRNVNKKLRALNNSARPFKD